MLHDIGVGYLRRGWSIFPTIGKDPFSGERWGPLREKMIDHSEFVRVLERGATGLALVCGQLSDVYVVACDTLEGSELLLEHLLAEGDTPVFARSKKGLHFYFGYDERIPHKTQYQHSVYGEVDLRTEGGYVLLPPSLHPEGPIYTWVVPPGPVLPRAPDWLVDDLYDDENHASCSEIDVGSFDRVDTGLSQEELLLMFSLAAPRRWAVHILKKAHALGIAEPGERHSKEIAFGGHAAKHLRDPYAAIIATEIYRHAFIPTRRERHGEERDNISIRRWAARPMHTPRRLTSLPRLRNRPFDDVNRVRRRAFVASIFSRLEVLEEKRNAKERAKQERAIRRREKDRFRKRRERARKRAERDLADGAGRCQPGERQRSKSANPSSSTTSLTTTTIIFFRPQRGKERESLPDAVALGSQGAEVTGGAAEGGPSTEAESTWCLRPRSGRGHVFGHEPKPRQRWPDAGGAGASNPSEEPPPRSGRRGPAPPAPRARNMGGER